ncbi:MAG: nucleotide sugar dehydrogenase, partial [Alphaproteobacteria bacterium]|nr:nucleotide sugar dehydrogenase [Alphaproteobacteria bacterium]
EAHCGVRLLTELEDGNYDCLIGAVAHAPYRAFEADDFERLLAPEGLLADLKGIWRGRTLPAGMQYWEL